MSDPNMLNREQIKPAVTHTTHLHGPVLDHTQNLLETKTAPIIINISSFSCFVWKDPKINQVNNNKEKNRDESWTYEMKSCSHLHPEREESSTSNPAEWNVDILPLTSALASQD